MRALLTLGFIFNIALLFNIAPVAAIETQAQQAYIVDFETGQVLLDKNAEQKTPTSSMSKVMTSYMVFDAIKQGRLKKDSEFLVSEKAWKKGGSKMFVPLGEKVKVEDLLRGVIIQSGNDATIVLAEGFAGTEDAFAKQITAKAKSLGMQDSNFVNASGWPDEGHYSTAKDLSIMARSMIKEFPDYYKMFAETEYTYGGIKQANRNPLLYQNIGADGMKTGHTEAAGYGLIGSAVRDNRRVVMVLNGMESSKERTEESTRLMTWALTNFKNISLFAKSLKVTTATVTMGEVEQVDLMVKEPIKLTIGSAQAKPYKLEAVYKSPLVAPIKQGQEVGMLHITIDGEKIEKKSFPIYAQNDVEQAGLFTRFIIKAKTLILGKI